MGYGGLPGAYFPGAVGMRHPPPPPDFFDKPSVEIKMVDKMVINFDKMLVEKITVIIIGGKTEMCCTSFEKNTLACKWKQYLSILKKILGRQMELNIISFGNSSPVDRMKIVFVGSYLDTLIRSKFSTKLVGR